MIMFFGFFYHFYQQTQDFNNKHVRRHVRLPLTIEPSFSYEYYVFTARNSRKGSVFGLVTLFLYPHCRNEAEVPLTLAFSCVGRSGKRRSLHVVLGQVSRSSMLRECSIRIGRAFASSSSLCKCIFVIHSPPTRTMVNTKLSPHNVQALYMYTLLKYLKAHSPCAALGSIYCHRK